ncbi:Irregular chiasm C-roughest protein [Eumeta japonica]|uniref:Irregular chiasm C-roughest protein n=1 Tax=Eumeta variegata TaxID=151549 RepID=A0A4C1ZL08_EUMVA|nr:Irregular chiasm C-roughest protein [Eumeta japonica]
MLSGVGTAAVYFWGGLRPGPVLTAARFYRVFVDAPLVKYAPKVNVQVKHGSINGKIPEGANVVVECVADANPTNLTFKWYINEELAPGNHTTEMHIKNVTRDYNDAIIKCVVYNDVGKSEESETLEVTYAPTFRNLPQDTEAEIGSVVTLSCDVDGHPAPEIRWLHYEDDHIIRVGRTPNLTITLDTHTSGRYMCKATVEGYPDVEADATVYIKGPPKILSNRTQFGTQGDSVKVECAAFAIPRLESIVWLFDGKEIDSLHDQDFTFQEDLSPGGIVNSTLLIRETQSHHFGTYKCNVSNEYGSDSLEIALKANKTFPLLLILFGVMSGTVMVTAMIMLVILCQRKQRKSKPATVTEKPDVTVTAEELYKENDRNSNISDLKLELRQANGNCEVHRSHPSFNNRLVHLVPCQQDYSNTGSDSTLCSNAKLGSGIPLAGSVPLSSINQNNYNPYRYSNDYSDPAYADCYKVNGYGNGYQSYVHYGPEYAPAALRVQSPTHNSDKLTPNRSVNGSLPRSVDSTSTVQYNPGNSQSNSLQRSIAKRDSSSALNSLGLPPPGSEGT